MTLFLNDNLGDSIRESAHKTYYYFSPCIGLGLIYYLISFTQTYADERAVVILLMNFIISNLCLSLMLTNMAKKPFSVIQTSFVFGIIPIIFGNSDFDVWITRACCVGALV